jgi:ankyrin repeat protein
LLGIFNINMPLLYGEGERAFVRLQEEIIIKVSTDYSLFAWAGPSAAQGLLAPNPRAFSESARIVPIPAPTNRGGAATVDSEGVHVRLRLRLVNEDTDTHHALFPCTFNGRYDVGITIRGQVEGFFKRKHCGPGSLLYEHPSAPGSSDYVVKRICVQQPRVRRHGDALQEAVKTGNKAVVNFLLEHGVHPICETPSSSAAGNGHEAIVINIWDYDSNALVARRCQIDQRSLSLSLAVENGHHEIVKVLLDRLDHLYGYNGYYFPELHDFLMLALRNGHCGVLKVLAEHGGHMAREALCHPEAFDNAIRSDSGDVVELLITVASKFTRTTGQIPMLDSLLAHSIIRFDETRRSHHDVIQVLLKYYPDLPQQRIFGGSRGGSRPLDWAVRDNHEDLVKLLLRHADAGKAELSHEAISLAAAGGHESILRLLVAESDHFKESIVQINVLRVAIDKRQEGVVKLVLEEGFNLDYVDSVGETPLSWAARLGHGDKVDLLRAHGAAQHMDEQAKGAPTSL